jgi:hypothetical protein
VEPLNGDSKEGEHPLWFIDIADRRRFNLLASTFKPAGGFYEKIILLGIASLLSANHCPGDERRAGAFAPVGAGGIE